MILQMILTNQAYFNYTPVPLSQTNIALFRTSWSPQLRLREILVCINTVDKARYYII